MSFIMEKKLHGYLLSSPKAGVSGRKVWWEALDSPKPNFTGLEDLSLSGRVMLNRILGLNVNSIYEEKCNYLKKTEYLYLPDKAIFSLWAIFKGSQITIANYSFN